MKMSLITNDKSTSKDELIIGAFTLIALTISIILLTFKPSIWLISSSMTVTLGVLLLMFSIMMIPCIIYRLFTNNKEDITNE